MAAIHLDGVSQVSLQNSSFVNNQFLPGCEPTWEDATSDPCFLVADYLHFDYQFVEPYGSSFPVGFHILGVVNTRNVTLSSVALEGNSADGDDPLEAGSGIWIASKYVAGEHISQAEELELVT